MSLLTETLRKVPVLPVLDRVAGTDYVIPGTNITIEKGTTVYVPLLGLHLDGDVYPDPDHYDPERFSEENRKTRHPYMYLPFGEGPKYCLGRCYFMFCAFCSNELQRMWKEAKVALFEILSCDWSCRSHVSCGQLQDRWLLGWNLSVVFKEIWNNRAHIYCAVCFV